MKKVLLHTSYFAPIDYYAAILQVDELIIESQENYQKKSIRSRCYIAGPNGKQMLNVPVVRPDGPNSRMQSVQLSLQQNWRKQHWNSIITAYNSSPFLLYYQDEIKDVLFEKYNSLWELNNSILILMLDILQIKSKISFTKTYEKNTSDIIDLRNCSMDKNLNQGIDNSQKYIQVFADKYDFIPNLSILDLLFNLGPESGAYLRLRPEI